MNWIEDAVLYKPNSRWVAAILIGQSCQVGFTHDPSLSAMYLILGPSCVKLCQNQLKRATITHKRILFLVPLSKNIASFSHSNTTTVFHTPLQAGEVFITEVLGSITGSSWYVWNTLLVAWTARLDEPWG